MTDPVTETRGLLEAASDGDWALSNEVGLHDGCDTYVVDNDAVIAEIMFPGVYDQYDEEYQALVEGNARLIAASPRLLAALLARIEELETGIERHREDFRKSHVTGSTSWDCDEELWRLLVVRDGMNTEQEQP